MSQIEGGATTIHNWTIRAEALYGSLSRLEDRRQRNPQQGQLRSVALLYLCGGRADDKAKPARRGQTNASRDAGGTRHRDPALPNGLVPTPPNHLTAV